MWTEEIVVFVCHEDLECTRSVIFSAFKCAHTQKNITYTPTVLCLERYSASARPRWSVKPLDVVKNKRGSRRWGHQSCLSDCCYMFHCF